MERISLEELMKRRMKRTAAFEVKQLNREQIKSAVLDYLERFPTFFIRGHEIIDIDIPALTTELVDVKIYTKEV